MYVHAWKFLFSIDQSIQKVEEMLSTGIVEISRFSSTGFEPLLQVGEFAVDRNILNQEGCYVFIRGTECTMTLDHRPSDWYNREPFWTGSIDINHSIVDAKNPELKNLREKLSSLLNDMKLYREVYGTWGREIIDIGIFIDGNVDIKNILCESSTQNWERLLMTE